MAYLIVFFGGGLGAALRHGVNMLFLKLLGPVSFPIGTLTINVIGSFMIGLMTAYFAYRSGLSQHWRLFAVTGVLGGFTTFSSFSLEVGLLWERNQPGLALLYVCASFGLGVGALFLALSIFRAAFGGTGL